MEKQGLLRNEARLPLQATNTVRSLIGVLTMSEDNILRIGVHGARGKLGRLIIQETEKQH